MSWNKGLNILRRQCANMCRMILPNIPPFFVNTFTYFCEDIWDNRGLGMSKIIPKPCDVNNGRPPSLFSITVSC